MGRNTSISLSTHFESFISSSIESGKYNSASEVVRSALRLLESEERKIREIRHALIEGEKSAMVQNFDAKNHLEELHRKHL
jgi:antitoxin ParD1/3/4